MPTEDAWPGVARPAEWFLLTPQPPPAPATVPAPQAVSSPGQRLPAANGREINVIPSPHREPDGSWSSPLAPAAPAGTNTARTLGILGPTKALGGRAGGS
ncbi:MAG: hypothetical protein M3Z75_26180, partial [Actinomycetota bacterium]|nr:hypothetical protein [Actinomycetota bacterium]